MKKCAAPLFGSPSAGARCTPAKPGTSAHFRSPAATVVLPGFAIADPPNAITAITAALIIFDIERLPLCKAATLPATARRWERGVRAECRSQRDPQDFEDLRKRCAVHRAERAVHLA